MALLVVARIDPWEHNLYEEMAAMLRCEAKDLPFETPILREAYEKGQQDLAEKMLRKLFVRRIGRMPTETEQQTLSTKAHAGDPDELQDRALSLEGDALAAWLLDPSAK